MSVKEEFHQLIDSIEDEKALRAYYELVQNLNNEQTGELWNKLSDDQKGELLMSYAESFDENNLVSHEEVMGKYSKWLK